MRVGEALLLRGVTRVGVYFTERVEELESDVMLRRRAATGILDWGDRRRCGFASPAGVTVCSSPPNVGVAAVTGWL